MLSGIVWQTDFSVEHHIQLLSKLNLGTFSNAPEKLLMRHSWSVEHRPAMHMNFWITDILSSHGGPLATLGKAFKKELLNLKHVGIKPI